MSAESLSDTLLQHAGPWTEDEFLALPEGLGRVELLDGALLMSPQPTVSHQRLARQVGYALDLAAPEGVEVVEAVNVRVRPGRILCPDVVVTTHTGFSGSVFDAEDIVLVVEVTSPSNAGADRITKPDAYARAGIPHYVRLDLHRGPDLVAGTVYGLGPGGLYAEVGRSDTGGVLTLGEPYPVALDLPAAVRATRYPRRTSQPRPSQPPPSQPRPSQPRPSQP